MKPLHRRPTARLALLLSLTIASGCGERAKSTPVAPSAADVEASIAPKPVPAGGWSSIIESEKASEDYNASLEAWGDGISAAAGRMCRYWVALGVKFDFTCPAAAK